jgi:hypothetical protein
LKPGAIVGDTSYHDPARRIRFGVVLAPDPSPLVRRIISDDPAIWRPAVALLCRLAWPAGQYPDTAPAGAEQVEGDEDYVSRCDYCGTEFSLDKRVQLRWAYTYMTEAGKGLHTTGIFCSEPCARWSDSRSGSTRG